MSGRSAPPKPWERQGGGVSTSSVTPLGPSTAGDSVRKPWETSAGASVGAAAPVGGALANRSRPWQTGAVGSYGGSNYGNGGAYGSHAYGSSPYGGSSYGGAYGSGVGGMYGGSAYGGGSLGGSYSSYGGSSMYGRPVGAGYGGTYGGGYGSAYGSGNAYGGGYGTGVGAYGGGGMYGQPYGAMAPYGSGGPGGPLMGPEGPPAPPSAWQAMLHTISGVVHFFGRLSFLVDENAHAVHFFVHALLQLLDRAGSLYGELARFVLRLLGYKSPAKTAAAACAPGDAPPGGPAALPGAPKLGPLPGAPAAVAQPFPKNALPGAPVREGAGGAGGPGWDGVWGKP